MLYQGSILLTNEGGISESELNLRLQDFENSLNIDAKLEEFKNSLNLGTADNMFIATYGVTTNAEIETAYNANKWIFAIYSGRLCPLATRSSATKHYFISNAGTGALQLTCLNNEWSYQTISYTNQSHGSTHAPGGSDPISGYLKVETGSYTGTGYNVSSTASSVTLNFQHSPIVVFISTTNQYPQTQALVRGSGYAGGDSNVNGNTTTSLTWNEKSLIISNTYYGAIKCFNESGATYYYYAIYTDD